MDLWGSPGPINHILGNNGKTTKSIKHVTQKTTSALYQNITCLAFHKSPLTAIPALPKYQNTTKPHKPQKQQIQKANNKRIFQCPLLWAGPADVTQQPLPLECPFPDLTIERRFSLLTNQPIADLLTVSALLVKKPITTILRLVDAGYVKRPRVPETWLEKFPIGSALAKSWQILLPAAFGSQLPIADQEGRQKS